MSCADTDASSSAGSSPEFRPTNRADRRKLRFSIENILDPEFGTPRQAKDQLQQTPSPNFISPNKFFFDPTSLCSQSLSPTQPLIPSISSLSDPRTVYPAWVFCTRYSDRPISVGGRQRRPRKQTSPSEEEKRPRTAFTPQQLNILKQQFMDNRYLTERRRQELAHELGLNESQIKIWFQNKRAKLKKATGDKPSFPLNLMTSGMFETPNKIN